MSIKVVLSKTAESKLENLFEYLVKEWSKKVKKDFVEKLDSSIEIIKNQPKIFESKKGNGLRRYVITKQTTLCYRYNSKRINIVTLFDTRQNPNKLDKEI